MRSRLVHLGGTIGMVTLVAAAAASPAGALTYVNSTQVAVGAGTQGAAVVDCPAGQDVLGGGVYSSGGINSSYVNASQPFDGPDQRQKKDDAWRAYADAEFGVNITASAVCDDRKVRVVEESSQIAGNKRKDLVARCPDGQRATGGGVSNSGSYGMIEVEASHPVGGGSGWRARLRSFHPQLNNIFAFALCVDGGFANKLDYRSKSATANSGTQNSRGVQCKGNDRVVGGGVSISKGSGSLNGSVFSGEDSWISWVDANGSENVKFTTYAVCR